MVSQSPRGECWSMQKDRLACSLQQRYLVLQSQCQQRQQYHLYQFPANVENYSLNPKLAVSQWRPVSSCQNVWFGGFVLLLWFCSLFFVVNYKVRHDSVLAFICPIQPSYTFPMPSPQEIRLLVLSLPSAQRDFTYLLSLPMSRQDDPPDSITDTISSNSAHIREPVLGSPDLLCSTEFKTGQPIHVHRCHCFVSTNSNWQGKFIWRLHVSYKKGSHTMPLCNQPSLFL